MASPYKALQRCVKCFGTNSETVGHKDLRFGQIVYILVFYNISFSWLLPLDGFKCIFLCRVYCVTVKTKNSSTQKENILNSVFEERTKLDKAGLSYILLFVLLLLGDWEGIRIS